MENNNIINLAEKVIKEYKENLEENNCFFDEFYNNCCETIDDLDYKTIVKIRDYIDEKYNLEDYITYNKTENIEELTLNDIVTILNYYDNNSYENSDYYYYFIQNNKIYCGIKQQYTKINKK